MKSTIILLILLTFNISFSQKIEGIYKYESISKEKQFEIQIKNDSTFVIKSQTSDSESQGKLRRKKGKFYYFIQYDSVAKRNLESLIKICRTKIIFYGYKQIRPGKVTKKQVKGFELKKASH